MSAAGLERREEVSGTKGTELISITAKLGTGQKVWGGGGWAGAERGWVMRF